MAFGSASAQDLQVVADEEHLWLVVESAGEDGEQVEVYHRAAGDDPVWMQPLEPIPGRLRPGGIAAGDGRLILVMDSGEVVTRTPYLPPMDWGWSYRAGTLAALPDGCGLRSMVADDQGVWALVRVDSAKLLRELDAPPDVASNLQRGRDDRLNAAIGLPPGVDLPGRGNENSSIDDTESDTPGDADDAADDTGGAADASEDDRADEGEADVPESGETPAVDPIDDAAAGDPLAEDVPVYRLLRLGERGWHSVPLPAGFGLPRQAALVVRGPADDRPAVVSEPDRGGGEVVVSLPVGESQWAQSSYYLPGSTGRLRWSAVSLLGQVYVGVERERDARQVVVDLYLLRGRRRANAGVMWVNTLDTARWRLLSLGSEAVLLARPDAGLNSTPADPRDEVLVGAYHLPDVLLGAAPAAEGEPAPGLHVDYYRIRHSRWEKNADWIIQIVALLLALVTLMAFWKRTPQGREVALPEHIHLVPWSRRLLSTLIDLMPGLWIAGLLYGMEWGELILRHWPGTPIPKPPDAMWPGWLVIGITVFHTTVFEFITARSIGKWLTGTYVSDFRGVPAPPGASLVRAVSRVFELVAWLLLLLPLISPHRQRLGDILAKTLVVYRDTPPPEDKPEDDGA